MCVFPYLKTKNIQVAIGHGLVQIQTIIVDTQINIFLNIFILSLFSNCQVSRKELY